MKRLIPWLVALLAFTSLPAHASAPAKPGSACVKQGAKAKVLKVQYVCKKSGKRFIWTKSTTKSQSSNSVSPTPKQSASPENPFAAPFPDKFNRTQMVESALEKFNAYIKKSDFKLNYKLVVDPQFQATFFSIRNYTDRIYKALPFPADYPRTIVVITEDVLFPEKYIQEMGFNRADVNQAIGPCIGCAGYGWAVLGYSIDYVMPHEIFHVWQRQGYNRQSNNGLDPNNPNNPPVWWDEGSADFFGYAMARNYSSSNTYPGLLGGTYKSLLAYSTRDLDRNLPYVLGRAASEYIVASVGMEQFLQIFYNVGFGQTFPTAFQNATGISLNDFYRKFDANIGKMIG